MRPTRLVSAYGLPAVSGFFVPGWWSMPPRPGIEPGDLVTPAQAGALLGIPASTVRTWIQRYQVERIGMVGRWPVYDYREIAVIEARKSARQAA
jgi:hypothetical protein